jgi:soluble lytic murein transglycosylase-like protein
MSVISNYEFNISVIIVSGIRLLSKGITGTILFLSIFILWNTCAYATDTASPKGYWLKKYIAAVEQKNRIPIGLLSAIAGVESDFNPYAVNIAGKTVIASNQEEAAKTIKNALNSGITNIDIGIAQINYRWHGDNFKNIEEMINPVTNIEYAAKLLSSLFKQHGTWHKALRYYHSATPYHHRKYSRKVVIAWLGNSQLIK